MLALAKEGLLDATLEGIICSQVDNVKLAAVVAVAVANQQVVHVGGGLRTGPHLVTKTRSQCHFAQCVWQEEGGQAMWPQQKDTYERSLKISCAPVWRMTPVEDRSDATGKSAHCRLRA